MQIQHIALRANDNVGVAEFYKRVFGLVEVHRTYHAGDPGGVYLSDGHINLTILLPHGKPEGIAHFGFKIDADDVDHIHNEVVLNGGRIGEFREKKEQFAETHVLDPIGTKVDLAVAGWRLQPLTKDGAS